MTPLRATYRLQLGPRLGLRAARALVPYLRDLGVSHLYLPPSFQARTGSTHGYDVVDPASISDELGGEAAFGALVRRGPRGAGMGIVLDIVPNHMATDDANRYWTRPGAARAVLRHRPGDRPPPALLRRRRPRRRAPGGPRGVRRDARAGARARARGRRSTGCGSTTPTGSPTRRATSAPARRRRRARLGGEDPRARRAPARLARRGDGRLRVPQRRRGAVRRSRGRGGADRPVGGGRRATTGRSPSGRSRPSSSRRGRRSRPRSSGCCATRPSGWPGSSARSPRCRSTAPTSSRGGPRRRRRPRGARRGAAAGSLAARAAARETPGDAFVTRFQQTTPPVMAKGVEDTAFYRYARLLALNDVGGDPGRFGVSVGRLPRRQRERARRFPRNLLVTQTHDTKRSGDVRARIGALAAMAEEWARHVRTLASRLPVADLRRRARPGRAATSSSRRCSARGRSRRSGSRPTSRRRCARPSAHELDRPRTRRTRRAVQAFARALLTHRAVPARLRAVQREVAAAGERAALGQLLLKLTVPGRARHLPGRRAAAPVARRPRQPPPGRLGRAPAPRWPTRRRKLRLIGGRWSCARAAPRRSRAPTSRSTPARRRARSCAAATSSPAPAARRRRGRRDAAAAGVARRAGERVLSGQRGRRGSVRSVAGIALLDLQ